jgi:predicted RNase H-like HicB family nuclease
MKDSLRRFTAILEPAEEGGYVVKCLELPVATEGETKSEAVWNIREAVEGYLEVRAEVLGRSKAKKKQMVEITYGT